jgi:hypothetical protein
MHPLDGAYFRVEWAEKRLLDLQGSITAYAKEEIEANDIDVEFQPGGQLTLTLSDMSKPPPDIAVLLGEVVYHLRSAMDYLVFELAKADSGKSQKGTQFPIEDSPQGFAGRRKTYLKGVSQPHVDAIEGLQPYRGCDWTHDLKTISNPDKHRELIGAFGTQETAFAVAIGTPDFLATLPGKLRPIRGDPANRYAKVHHEVATFSVTFSNGPPIIELLEILKSQVAQTLDAFKPEFK